LPLSMVHVPLALNESVSPELTEIPLLTQVFHWAVLKSTETTEAPALSAPATLIMIVFSTIVFIFLCLFSLPFLILADTDL